MKTSLIDVPVLLIFFTRVEQTAKVFEEIKKARPSKLYLYQDGGREGRADDIINIQKCRTIVEDIDWDCKVYKKYQECNVGCDPSEYISQKWMFDNEEYGIVLEDDDVPSQSFFPFCKELLEKYKDDLRINMICGMNHEGVSEHIKESYLFSKPGSIWGWASWKRVIETWDSQYKWLDDDDTIYKLRNAFNNKSRFENFLKTAKKHRSSGKAHYESIYYASSLLNNRLNIVPKYNMISNIGVGSETTHNVSDVKFLPRTIRKKINMKRYEIEFPLIHPNFVTRDIKFEKKRTRSRMVSFISSIESVILRIFYGDFKSLKKGIKRRLKL